ncbi:MAG TPA: pyridoxamine 5'-phosphate oxidase family protein [Candidatus Binatia bacterium]|nr:pyridoxamine 5'-phosphate oxidase family protein [Candidatus Binatia bacterium]
MSTIDTTEALRALYGQPGERAIAKEQARLDEHTRAFIAVAPFLVMGTAGADGRCDVSPKGDAPGFVHVLDDHHLAIPDRLGNNRLDGLRNVIENAHVALLFLIPGREDTLRVNGRATISRDEALLERLAVNGKRPQTVLVVEVEQAFMHCTRAFKRAGLWEQERWPDASSVPSMQRMIWDLLPARPAGQTVEQYEHESNERQKILY